MKKIIIIIFTIILGIYIGTNFIMGDGDSGTSFQGGAEAISRKTTSEIDKMTKYSGSGLGTTVK